MTMSDNGYMKRFLAKDLYSTNSGGNRFEFLCFLYTAKDIGLINGYMKTMKVVFDKYPYMGLVLEKAKKVIEHGNVIGKLQVFDGERREAIEKMKKYEAVSFDDGDF